MSNIDLSRILTAEDMAAEASARHATAAKGECKRRILARIPFEAQQNIAQAVTLYTAEIVGGASEAEASARAGLAEEDVARAGAARQWVAAMQAACRAVSADPQADPASDTVWPGLPEGVADLVARF